MKLKHHMVVLALLSFLALAGLATPVAAQGPAGYIGNMRVKEINSPTGVQQTPGKSDQAITKQIRAAIAADKSLSMAAHNVKVTTQDGKVTLKGPVRSNDERSNIAAKAAAVAGVVNVDNQMDVASAKS